MRVQIQYHSCLHQTNTLQLSYQQGNIGIRTEPGPLRPAAVMEAPTYVDGPAALHSQLAG